MSSRLRSALRQELDWVVMKALEKDRSRRYQSALELAADIGRYLADELVTPRPPSRAYRLKKFARRHRAGVVMAALSLFALTTLAAVSTLFSIKLSESLRESNRRAAAFYFERGQAAFERNEVGPGLVSMVESWRSAVAARDPAWQHTARAALSAWQRQNPRVRFVFSHAEAIRSVGFSPDGRTAFTASLDNTVRLWDAITGQPIGEPLVHRLPPNVVVFTADCTRVLTGDEAGVSQFWDAATGKRSGPALIHGGPVRGLAISPDGKTVLTGSGGAPSGWRRQGPRPAQAGDYAPRVTQGYNLRLWDAATGRTLAATPLPIVRSAVVAFSRDGKEGIVFSNFWAARASSMDLVPVASSMDLATGKMRPEWQPNSSGGVKYLGSGPIFPGARGSVDRSVAFSRDGGAMLSALGGRAVFRRLDAQGTGGSPTDGQTKPEITMEHRGTGRPVGIATRTQGPNQGFIGHVGLPPGRAHQVEQPKAEITMEHRGPIRAVALSPDGQMALTAGEDYTARLWSTETGKPLTDPLVHQLAVNRVAFSPDGHIALTGSDDGTARLWEVPTGKRLGVPLVHQAPVRVVAYSPDGKSILTGCDDGQARLWDPAIDRRVGVTPASGGGRSQFRAAACSPDGELVLTGGEDGAVRLWDARTGDPLGQPWAHERPVHAVAFSPDVNTILIGTWMQARLYDAATGEPRCGPLVHQPGFVRAVAFSPDGRVILTGGDDCRAWLWDAATGRPMGMPMGHNKPVSAVAYAPDGRTVAVVADTDVQVFDTPATVPPGRLLKHPGIVRAVLYGPDGKTLLTRSDDGRARLWNAATGEPRGQPLTSRGPIRAVAFAPDGKAVITGGEDSGVQVWDAATGQPLGEPLVSKGSVHAVGYSSDGKTIFIAAEDGTARFWDSATRRSLGTPILIPEKLASLQLSASGTTLLALGQDGSVRFWGVADLPDDLHRVAAWIEVSTALTADPEGSIKPLDHDALQQRRALLSRLGGPP
jgi:WD40 repeat protein